MTVKRPKMFQEHSETSQNDQNHPKKLETCEIFQKLPKGPNPFPAATEPQVYAAAAAATAGMAASARVS